ncbi:MAG: dTDP-4-dehydrorhamnose 3,5-epimerase [Pyrinomonadaceae bacterium]|jgi:dTDP-4-dehydrorhamnose 3,5-epimerase|nr:dTDP-4-dehydrorhamnose 3,5-epimerase [Pyrinomonadaceae bacterium]
MKLIETKLQGVYLVELQQFSDERGFYKRLWGKDELENLDLDSEINNVGLSFNKKCGTVRGMHYQAEPFAETKLVQCVKGKIFDVVLDLRKDSATFGEWISAELSPENNLAFYIPKGLAHGFQTLADNSEVLYTISSKYDLNSSRGVRWNDAKFDIKFPLEITCINERDAQYPDFEV